MRTMTVVNQTAQSSGNMHKSFSEVLVKGRNWGRRHRSQNRGVDHRESFAPVPSGQYDQAASNHPVLLPSAICRLVAGD
jgi:hypothetical protein